MKWRIAAIVLAWPISTVIVWGLLAVTAHCQILMRADLSPTKASAPLLGHGVSSYEWNIIVCPAGPLPVQWDEARLEFPEIRFYSRVKQDSVLAERIAESAAARFVKWGGRFAEVGGVGVQIETALKKSPAQWGNGITAVGLGMQLGVAWASKDIPKYAISNPVPDMLDLKKCGEFSNLAAFGKADVSIGPRLVRPVQKVDPIGVKP